MLEEIRYFYIGKGRFCVLGGHTTVEPCLWIVKSENTSSNGGENDQRQIDIDAPKSIWCKIRILFQIYPFFIGIVWFGI